MQGEEGNFSCQFTAYEANVQGIHEEDKLLDIEMKNKRIRTERGMETWQNRGWGGGATTGTIRTDQERIIQEDVHRVGR
jgi:hypothetical protein